MTQQNNTVTTTNGNDDTSYDTFTEHRLLQRIADDPRPALGRGWLMSQLH